MADLVEEGGGGAGAGDTRILTAIEELFKNHKYLLEVIKYCQTEYEANPGDSFRQTQTYTAGRRWFQLATDPADRLLRGC